MNSSFDRPNKPYFSAGRRDLITALAAGTLAGLQWHSTGYAQSKALYPEDVFGNVHFLHFTDCHAQLLPIYFREPNIIGEQQGGGITNDSMAKALQNYFRLHFPSTTSPDQREAMQRAIYAFTRTNYAQAAQRYGRMGGFAHLATLIKKMRSVRPGCLLLDGGDTWQGSATALWSKGEDMVDACLELGVDIMTGHWEFTFGAERVQSLINNRLKDRIAFVAQNIQTNDFGDPVFMPYSWREMNGIPVAVIGQAFPYTPVANPRHFVPDWRFGIQEENLQRIIDEVRAKGALVVVLLSHNGLSVDVKLASRVRGLDAILGGHTHDAMPQPLVIKNQGGSTLVTNAGSNGKFLAVLDIQVQGKKISDFRYRLLPVFSNQIPPDSAMNALIHRIRAPWQDKLSEPLAVTEELLYRRGSFNGTFDQLILHALIKMKGAEIAFSPGFRWGTTLLPGQHITMEHLLDQTAITYPIVTLNELSGSQIKAILEDVGDNLFNPDPYYQQGGDMVRVAGLEYTCQPSARMGQRITNMRLSNGKLLEADKKYRVASWASVAENLQGEPIWELVATWLRDQKTIKPFTPYQPTLLG